MSERNVMTILDKLKASDRLISLLSEQEQILSDKKNAIMNYTAQLKNVEALIKKEVAYISSGQGTLFDADVTPENSVENIQ